MMLLFIKFNVILSKTEGGEKVNMNGVFNKQDA